ncbi:endonuclease/exonuclease/phosphatase family protein [Paenibacillus ferrarius]|uniref:endonuclease/exonuclease/phosphatase family protein n=1 Tax=Paenibacillus ferrarius TaxID=1469647 RepID=UPI003D28A1D9
MKCLFWNVNKKESINQILADVIEENNLDLLALAEYKDSENELLSELITRGIDFYYIPQLNCDRIHLFCRFKPGEIKPFQETNYYTTKGIPHIKLGYLTFVFVHLSSKLHNNDADELLEYSRTLKIDIEDIEKDVGSDRTIVVGDFNMNPFEKGMLGATGLHAFPTKFEARKHSRTIKEKNYKMFYNPMWSFLGDLTTPYGTYHYNASGYFQTYWHLFDQVLFRPSLLDHVDVKNVKILTEVKGKTLVNIKKIPSVSDHLPIFFEIK